jgi:hypothetical protein
MINIESSKELIRRERGLSRFCAKSQQVGTASVGCAKRPAKDLVNRLDFLVTFLS